MKTEDGIEPGVSDVKSCLICSSPTTASSHFGCLASCLACTAFFRRTVSLGIAFKCSSQRQCRIYYEQRILCKACRYDRCLAAGMKPECVQKRKHTGKRSRESKSRSVSPGVDIFENKAFLENFQKVQDTSLGSTAPIWSVSSQSTNSEVTDPKPSDLPPFELNCLGKEQVQISDIRSRDLLTHFVEEEKKHKPQTKSHVFKLSLKCLERML